MTEKGIDRLILFSDHYLCLTASRDDSVCCLVVLSKRLAFQSSASCARLRSTVVDAEMWQEIPERSYQVETISAYTMRHSITVKSAETS